MVKRAKKNKIKKSKYENLDNKILINFFDKKKYRAIIYNKAGEQIATVNLPRDKNLFNYKNFNI